MSEPMPYVMAGRAYHAAGWSPIPLPYERKAPPPDGYTGASGTYVTEAEVIAWTRKTNRARANAGSLSYPPGNIGLRMPRNVIGVDVDLYDGKAGQATLDGAEARWGVLPRTWTSSSRTDGSGIRFFRIPEGLSWPGEVGKGVETLKWDHRFALVCPSIHPDTKGTYVWIRPDGVVVDDEFPSIEELPELPQTWVDGLTNGAVWEDRPEADMSQKAVLEWLNARNVEMCESMRSTLTRYSRDVRERGEDGGAHEVARNGAWALIGDAAAGHGGIIDALGRLRKVFLAAVGKRREEGGAKKEWARIVIKGVKKVVGEGNKVDDEDICALLGNPTAEPSSTSKSIGGTGGRNTGSGAFDFARDDIGNAQRLAQRVGTDARFVTGMGAWATYDATSSLWDIDLEGSAIRREMMAVVRGMETEAKFIEDPKAQAAFMAWVRRSGGAGSIGSAISLAQAMKGMTVEAGLFDADPEILVCSNGTLELNGDGVEFRGTRHGDYATFSSGTRFDPKATLADWDKFIGRVLPDESDRIWVQTLAGYSLLGLNPERVMVMAKGETTSGKSTFAEAIMGALGGYASAFNLSMFREKQDEAPRADVVSALPKRIIVASEASSDWFLQADTIKRFTGGDLIRARRLNSNIYVERVPAFTPWLVTNAYPQVPGADRALWRRLKTAPFMVEIPEDEVDVGLKRRLSSPDARAAILAWAVRGWERYVVDGLREPSHNASLMLAEAREEMSELDSCLAETCEFGTDYTDHAMRLYEIYKMWNETHGDPKRQLSLTAWGRAMSSKGFSKVKRPPEAGSERRIWWRTGVRLNEEWARVGAY